MSVRAPAEAGALAAPVPGSDVRSQVHDAARRARVAARTLGSLTTTAKDRALHAAADAVLAHVHQILAANAEDLDAARAAGTPEAMLDRLALNPQRVDGIAAGLRQVAGLPDPMEWQERPTVTKRPPPPAPSRESQLAVAEASQGMHDDELRLLMLRLVGAYKGVDSAKP